MVVWVGERGLAHPDVRVKGSTVQGPRVQHADCRGAPGAAALRRPLVSCRSAGGQRVDPAQRGGPCSVLGLSDRHGRIDAALTAVVAAGAAMSEERVAEQDNRRNLLVGRAMPQIVPRNGSVQAELWPR
jgi:hypothetical protein